MDTVRHNGTSTTHTPLHPLVSEIVTSYSATRRSRACPAVSKCMARLDSLPPMRNHRSSSTRHRRRALVSRTLTARKDTCPTSILPTLVTLPLTQPTRHSRLHTRCTGSGDHRQRRRNKPRVRCPLRHTPRQTSMHQRNPMVASLGTKSDKMSVWVLGPRLRMITENISSATNTAYTLVLKVFRISWESGRAGLGHRRRRISTSALRRRQRMPTNRMERRSVLA